MYKFSLHDLNSSPMQVLLSDDERENPTGQKHSSFPFNTAQI